MLPIQIQRQRAKSLGLRCYYCEILLDPNTEGKRNSQTKDHIIPQSKNGNNTRFNKVYCCSSCNHLKANKDLDEFHKTILSKVDEDYRFIMMLSNIERLQRYKRKTTKKMIRSINRTIIKQIDKFESRHRI